MAGRSQRLAVDFLNPNAVRCYWFNVLQKLASLLRYKPGRAHRQYDYLITIRQYLESSEGQGMIKKYKLQSMEL